MTSCRILLDTSDELIIKRRGNGVQLINPDKISKKENSFVRNVLHPTVKDIMDLPINFYFVNTEHVIQNLNNKTVEVTGYKSVKDAIGRTVRSVAKPEAADFSMNHDLKVMKLNEMQIIEEHFARLDDIDFQAISVKFPWYNSEDKIIGVFGFSITMGLPGSHPLTDSLELIAKTNLLSNSQDVSQQILPGMNVGGIHLSKRESECLYYLLRGMTAKSIARILELSPRTVECHLKAIKVKMGVSSKIELIEKLSHHFILTKVEPNKENVQNCN